MQELFLHIGMHKTASSSIQRVLSDNSTQLRQAGIHYPDSGRPKTDPYAQHLLAQSICKQQGAIWADEWDSVIREIAALSAPRVVLSTEGFTLCDRQQIAEIQQKLTPFRVTVVVYVRNSVALMLSRYKQQIKAGKTRETAAVFFEDRCEYCDYSTLAINWSAAFGADCVRIRLYDKLRSTPGIVDDFLSLVGGPSVVDLVTTSGKSTNVSPTDAATLALLALNQANVKWARLRRHIVRGTLVGRFLIEILRPFTRKQLVTPKEMVELRNTLRSFNEQFCSRFLDADDYHFMSVDP